MTLDLALRTHILDVYFGCCTFAECNCTVVELEYRIILYSRERAICFVGIGATDSHKAIQKYYVSSYRLVSFPIHGF